VLLRHEQEREEEGGNASLLFFFLWRWLLGRAYHNLLLVVDGVFIFYFLNAGLLPLGIGEGVCFFFFFFLRGVRLCLSMGGRAGNRVV